MSVRKASMIVQSLPSSGLFGNDQENIIAMPSIRKYDTNTGSNKLPNSEIMCQSLMSKGNSPGRRGGGRFSFSRTNSNDFSA
jgi:hypothetical protein